MLKKILTCFTLTLALLCAATTTAFAKPAELIGINAFDADSDTVRIEISYDGGKIDSGSISTDARGDMLDRKSVV